MGVHVGVSPARFHLHIRECVTKPALTKPVFKQTVADPLRMVRAVIGWEQMPGDVMKTAAGKLTANVQRRRSHCYQDSVYALLGLKHILRLGVCVLQGEASCAMDALAALMGLTCVAWTRHTTSRTGMSRFREASTSMQACDHVQLQSQDP